MLNELEFIVFQSRIEISKFLTKGGICQANSRNIYSCLSKITLPVLEKKRNFSELYRTEIKGYEQDIIHLTYINNKYNL